MGAIDKGERRLNIAKGITKLKNIKATRAAFLIIPIYGVAWILFKTAIVRDNKSVFLQNKYVKSLINKLDGTIRTIKNNKIQESENEKISINRREHFRIGDKGKMWFMKQNIERITVTSYDGLKLVGYYLPSEIESDKVILLMHGYRADGFVNFGGLMEFYHNRGYHLLVPYQRSHGESEGTYICYGVKERYDVKKWIQYITKRFDEKCRIFLSGVSMGGATVLMAAGLELPKQVKGIVADCGFTSPWDILSHVTRQDYHLTTVPFLYAANSICKRKAGFYFKECSTISSMKCNKIPVLFIHGGKDTFVPTEMSYKNYEACAAPKEILIVDEAAHGTSYLVEPEAYKKTVIEFMEKWENGN